MSELQIDSELASDLECEVGDTISLTVTGTVTEKTPDGGKTLDVTSVEDYSHEGEPEESEPEEPMTPTPRKGKSAVMIMVGKGK